jgi:transcriptional regulator with XRE-family HTH domain
MSKNYLSYLRSAKKSVEYWRQLAVRDFTEGLIFRLRLRKCSQAELAKRLDVKPAYISRIIRGSDNLTLQTMVKIAMAVGGKVRIHIAEQSAETKFEDFYTGHEAFEFEQDASALSTVDYRIGTRGVAAQMTTELSPGAGSLNG